MSHRGYVAKQTVRNEMLVNPNIAMNLASVRSKICRNTYHVLPWGLFFPWPVAHWKHERLLPFSSPFPEPSPWPCHMHVYVHMHMCRCACCAPLAALCNASQAARGARSLLGRWPHPVDPLCSDSLYVEAGHLPLPPRSEHAVLLSKHGALA